MTYSWAFLDCSFSDSLWAFLSATSFSWEAFCFSSWDFWSDSWVCRVLTSLIAWVSFSLTLLAYVMLLVSVSKESEPRRMLSRSVSPSL